MAYIHCSFTGKQINTNKHVNEIYLCGMHGLQQYVKL